MSSMYISIITASPFFNSHMSHSYHLGSFPSSQSGGHKADSEVDNELHEYELGDDDKDNGEPQRRRFRTRGREGEKDYDKDPQFADILGSCFENPQAAKAKVEERIRKKRDKILHTKTVSATPVKVTFDKFEFSNSYIWFEFFNTPLEKDISSICDLQWTKDPVMMQFKAPM